jgi:hypothetical protein
VDSIETFGFAKKRQQGGTISGRGKEEAGRLNFLAWRA